MTDHVARKSPIALVLALATLAAPACAQTAADATVELDGLQWATASNGADVRWREADAFCRELELEGHSDWRLPTLAELEALYDPDQPGGIRAPFQLDDCCLWSSTTLVELPADGASGIGADASRYRWGFLFDGGIRYYSIDIQPDGRALCTRDRE